MLNLVANGPSGYNLTNSLRFRSSASAYLNRTFSTPTSTTKQTFSFWVKRGALGTSSYIFDGGVWTAGGEAPISFPSDDTLNIHSWNGSSNVWSLNTTQVFRDPSSWYHIVIAVDTTQATASNRVLIYVNGSQVTSFSGASYPTQNSDSNLNTSGIVHTIGRWQGGASRYFDGYLTEFNFIDGQALTPSSFGSTNATTGVWQPAKYTGTYGTNGFYLPFKLNSTSTYQANYTTTSQYLNVASNAAFGYGTGDFTIEGWHYATASGTSYLFDQRTSTSQVVPALYISGGSYTVYINGAIPLTAGTVVTNQWVHWALVKSSGTTKLYINGISVGSFSDANNYITSPFIIGNVYTGTTYAWAGYLSNIRVVKGTAVYTNNFNPPSTPLTAISGTSLLTLQNSTIIDNSTNAFSITNNGSITTSTATPFVANIAGDASGNGNSWQPNNINYSTVGTTYDSMTDVPTLTSATVANYAVGNPLYKGSSLTISNANLTMAGAGGTYNVGMSTISLKDGKYYCEFTLSSGDGSTYVGICTANQSLGAGASSYLGNSGSQSYGYYEDGRKRFNTTLSAYGASYTTGDIIGIAYDGTAGTLTYYKNGTSQGTAFTGIDTTVDWFFAVSLYAGNGSFNFGQRPFSYTPPTGYVALNTYNLPTSTIVKGNKYMQALLYTGNGTNNRTVTGVGFNPSLTWVKSRSLANSHVLADSVRGTNANLYSDLTNAENAPASSGAGGIGQVTTDGFTLVQGTANFDNVNTNAATYVAWNWLAGTSSSSNTSGSITSTVSVNATAGFSIVTYTGTGANATVGHGLGVAPKVVLVKKRSAASSWVMYHIAFPATQRMILETTAAVATDASVWNSTAPTSSVFSLGNDAGVNGSGATLVAYCWAEISGFSKFGSFVGNGSADGTFVYTGFRPKYLLVKNGNAVQSWNVLDSVRNTYNVTNLFLNPNNSNAETSNAFVLFDFLSNGFKARSSDAAVNGSGNTMLFMAFAESPFKYANAR